MSVARYIPLTVLLGVGLLAVSSVTVPVEISTERFEVSDFQRFRSRYRELLNLPAQTRVELIQSVSHACQKATLTPSVLERIQAFSQTVADSNLETKEVREAARSLTEVIATRRMSLAESQREPATAQNKP